MTRLTQNTQLPFRTTFYASCEINGKTVGFRDFMSSWKRGKSSKHPQCFCSEDEILLLKGQQSMCKQGPPPNCAGSSQVCSLPHYAFSGVGWGGTGSAKVKEAEAFFFKWTLRSWGWLYSCSFVPFRIVTLESKGILWRATAHFEWLSVHPEHRKGTLAAPFMPTA